MKKAKPEPFIINRIKSVGYAFKGMFILIRTEPSIKVQFGIAFIVTIAGFFSDLTRTEWMFQIVMIGLVMSIEAINTALEHLADFVHPDYHDKIKLIKDIAAGAVLIASIVAIIIGLFIYLPKWL